MRFLFLIGLIALVVTMVACGSGDSSEYSEAEAIAMVKQDLVGAAQAMLLVQTSGVIELQLWSQAHELAVGEWSAEYQGDNIWEVYCLGKYYEYDDYDFSKNTGTATFHVYESSSLVEFVK